MTNHPSLGTGAVGFIGNHLVKDLLAQGLRVRAVNGCDRIDNLAVTVTALGGRSKRTRGVRLSVADTRRVMASAGALPGKT